MAGGPPCPARGPPRVSVPGQRDSKMAGRPPCPAKGLFAWPEGLCARQEGLYAWQEGLPYLKLGCHACPEASLFVAPCDLVSWVLLHGSVSYTMVDYNLLYGCELALASVCGQERPAWQCAPAFLHWLCLFQWHWCCFLGVPLPPSAVELLWCRSVYHSCVGADFAVHVC